MINRDTIRAVFMKHGFTIKEGQTDLKPYVYAAAEELLSLTQFTDTDVRMLYAIAAHMTREGSPRAADDLRNLAERVRAALPEGAQLACRWLTDEEIHTLRCAVENMRSAEDTERVIEARFGLAYRVEQIVNRATAQKKG
jgi:hypothetical protein